MPSRQILTVLPLFVLLASCTSEVTGSPELSSTPVVHMSTPTSVPFATSTATITPTPTPTLAPMTDFMKGLVYYPAGWGGDNRPKTEWILKNIALPTGGK